MNYLRLTLASLRNRTLTTTLTVLSIGLSVGLFVGVERMRLAARESFQGTVSGAQILAGARAGSVQLLLYAIFHIGNATRNVTYKSYKDISSNPAVEWAIPISLGDSYRGFRVVGTDQNFYKYYQFRDRKSLSFESGAPASDIFDVVLGADVARSLNHSMGKEIVISHGVAEKSLIHHDDKPFVVKGILAKTGTPIDRSVFITLEGMEAIHIDWKSGAQPSEEEHVDAQTVRKMKIQIGAITAFLMRMKSPGQILRYQRTINDYAAEPLTAVTPGAALQELWQTVGYAEDALRIISVFVVLVGLSGMFLSIYTTLGERRREMAILRALGARAYHIVMLLLLEAATVTIAGCMVGVGIVYALLFAFQPWIETQFGIFIPVQLLSPAEWGYLGIVIVCGILTGLIPAFRAYRNALHDGLSVRV
ncbi:MAG: ABC transporter permease [Leptospirales bacterium]|nr:ABC transporter permease [Leptospirales bacterium]